MTEQVGTSGRNILSREREAAKINDLLNLNPVRSRPIGGEGSKNFYASEQPAKPSSSERAIQASDPEEEKDTVWVYLPARPAISEGELIIAYETRELAPGRSVLPAFSSEKRLVEQLGAAQPWVKVEHDILVSLIGVAILAPDPIIESDAERWTEKEAAEYAAMIRREMRRSGK
ncbi:SAV_915 family protein [Actinomadura algeriensis]|uniref:SseB protein N-terminal domain-containing protein n=1 Tax=Actinomadura algeriensis TaxID=1679523 RepID=A0ABR9JRZ1_9ACTN|nr:SAV_915 family protein [Actinomadura algeriensis]MBE1533344.1 hypothetical protein [Actinomadura algeriensis]